MTRAAAVKRHLFADNGTGAFAVVDAAQTEDLPGRLAGWRAEHVPLATGPLTQGMDQVTPYLVRLEPEAAVTGWLLEEAWGRHLALFAASRANLRELRRHLRSLLVVRDPDGRALYFRYYDPRILRIYLRTCNTAEKREVFGPVDRFVAEDEDPAFALVFRVSGSAKAERIALETGGR